jgi:hypothetical protein
MNVETQRKEHFLVNAVPASRQRVGHNVGDKATDEGFAVMGKVLKFNARKLVRKGRLMSEREMPGKVIDFRKQKPVNNSESAETSKPDQAIAQALFFWSF